MSTFPVVQVVFCGLSAALLIGCGSSQAVQNASPSTPPVTVQSPPTPANLKGNWLIVGTSLPNFPVLPSPTTFSLSATLNVFNGEVYAGQTDFYPCPNSGAGAAGSLPLAAIAPDGTFTLQPLAATVTFTIKGAVPVQPGGTWSGTYTAANANSGCTPVGGSFTATPLPQLTGTFSGSGSLGGPNGGAATPITISLALQQGGPASLDPPQAPSPVNSVNALSGTITLSGSPCFTTGTSVPPAGVVFGSSFGIQFKMSDGSTLFVNGNFKDPQLSAVTLTTAHAEGGICDRSSGLFSVDLPRKP